MFLLLKLNKQMLVGYVVLILLQSYEYLLKLFLANFPILQPPENSRN